MQGFFFLGGLRAAKLTTSLCIATDDTVRFAVFSPISPSLIRALYFGQDAEATAHAAVVITSSVFTTGHFTLMADWLWSYCSLPPLRIPVGQCDGQASTATRDLFCGSTHLQSRSVTHVIIRHTSRMKRDAGQLRSSISNV